MVNINQKAPDFTLPDSTGQLVSLSDFHGKSNVVLYFYPEDDTPACTLQAQDFSATKAEYDALNTVVLGISDNTVTSHAKFCSKYGLTVTLLADPEHTVIEHYGSWGEKQLFGHHYMGTIRSTFLIDKDGIIRKIWPKVTAEGHARELLTTIRSLVLK